MKIIVNATHKGGEGKTTNSIMIAEYIAIIQNLRTLLIDMDPQGNLSSRYLKMEYDPINRSGKIPPLHPDYDAKIDLDWDGRSSIANIFYGDEVLPYPTAINNLEILPAHSQLLQDAEAVTKQDVVEKVHIQLKRFVSLAAVKEQYDVIIIDTPPSKGPLTIAAIKASTHMIIPAQMEQFSIEGIYGMLQLWKQETYSRGEGDPIQLVGILPNQVRDIKLHQQFLDSLKQTTGISTYVMPHCIKKRAIYSEILVEEANPKSIFELPQKHIARDEYERACHYIKERIFDHA